MKEGERVELRGIYGGREGGRKEGREKVVRKCGVKIRAPYVRENEKRCGCVEVQETEIHM